jgi:hypothetical protein
LTINYGANRKIWVTQASQNEFPEQKDFIFHWPVCCSSSKHKLPTECESCVFSPQPTPPFSNHMTR